MRHATGGTGAWGSIRWRPPCRSGVKCSCCELFSARLLLSWATAEIAAGSASVFMYESLCMLAALEANKWS